MNQLALPNHLQRLAGRGISDAALGGLSQGAVPSISIRAQRFTLIDAAGNKRQLDTNYMDVVIVDANPNLSKIYFGGQFDPSAVEHAPPDCFSDNGIGASRQALKPQSTSCKDCPHNVWGSDTSRVTGKATKACNDVKKLAVFLPDNPDMLFLLRVPPATLKLLGAYMRTVAGNNAEICMIVTRVSFDAQTQGVLNFAPVGWIDERSAATVEKVMDGKLAADLVGLNDTPYTGTINAAPAIAQPAQPQQIAPPPVIGRDIPLPSGIQNLSPTEILAVRQQERQAPWGAGTGTLAPPMQQPLQQAPVQPFVAPVMQPAAQAPWGAGTGTLAPPTQQPFVAPALQGWVNPQTAAPAPPVKGKRRTKAEMEAIRAAEAAALPQGAAPFAQAPAGQTAWPLNPAAGVPTPAAPPAVNTDAPVQIPAFLRGGQQAPPPAQQYGMQQNAPAPDKGLQDALNAALNLPTT